MKTNEISSLSRSSSRLSRHALATRIGIIAATLFFSVVASGNEKPVYGSDDRQEWDRADAHICDAGRATAAIVPKHQLERDQSDRWLLSSDRTLVDSNWCEDERFSDQPDLAICSAFLINESTLVTAAHCVNSMDDPEGPAYNCSDIAFVFDYAMMDDGEIRHRYRNSQIYQCKAIIAYHYIRGAADWAAIELDRPTDRSSLALYTGDLAMIDDNPLEVVGHPLGLPLKWIRNGRIDFEKSADSAQSNDVFTAAIDTFEGNSGSPVLVRNGNTPVVVGILSSGARDYTLGDRQCLSARACANGECSGEQVTRANQFVHLSAIQPQAELAVEAQTSTRQNSPAACL